MDEFSSRKSNAKNALCFWRPPMSMETSIKLQWFDCIGGNPLFLSFCFVFQECRRAKPHKFVIVYTNLHGYKWTDFHECSQIPRLNKWHISSVCKTYKWRYTQCINVSVHFCSCVLKTLDNILGHLSNICGTSVSFAKMCGIFVCAILPRSAANISLCFKLICNGLKIKGFYYVEHFQCKFVH